MIDRVPIFDVARAFAGGSLTQDQVTQLDRAIDDALDDSASVPDPPSIAEDNFAPIGVGPEGITLVKEFEGCRLKAYPDPGTGGDPWTIGWGTTRIDGKPVRPGMTITQARADELFDGQLAVYVGEVLDALGDAIDATSQAQFDALVSFHYNSGAIRQATLTRKHKAGDYLGAANEFGRWVFAGGKKMNGLVRRRAAEAALYRRGI